MGGGGVAGYEPGIVKPAPSYMPEVTSQETRELQLNCCRAFKINEQQKTEKLRLLKELN